VNIESVSTLQLYVLLQLLPMRAKP